MQKFVDFIKLKTLFSRLVVSFSLIVVLSITMFAVIVVPQEKTNLRVLFGILVGIVNVGLGVLAAYINHRLVIPPIKSILKMTSGIAKGEHGERYRGDIYDSDIVALVNHFNEIANAFENLEQMRKSFVANASHELKSPITSIQGFVKAILDGTVPECDRNKFLNVVYNESLRLSSLINSLLDLSRLESGKFPVVKSRFEINTVIKRILIRFEPEMLKRNIMLNIGFINTYDYVYADKSKIEQVLVNLIDNAIKYSPTATTLHVTTHIHDTKLYVSIKDEGIGISKKDQQLIWDRFYIADKARTPSKASTGLGLSIVKKIIDEHKEIIWVDSIKGEGTTFIFTLELFNPSTHSKRTYD